LHTVRTERLMYRKPLVWSTFHAVILAELNMHSLKHF